MKKVLTTVVFSLVMCLIFSSIPMTAFMEGTPIVVGSKEFTEQLIFGHLLKELIESNTDYEVDLKEGLGGTMVCFTALKSNEIDLYMEYTGTAYGAILQLPNEEGIDMYEAVLQKMNDEYGIKGLERIGFNNTYCLALPRAKAEQYGLEKISDLISEQKKFILAPSFEFAEREDGLKKLQKDYEGLEFSDIIPVEGPLKYISSENDQVDIVTAFSTDGMLKRFDMIVLEDDRKAMFPYEAFIMVREAALVEHPGLEEALNKLAGQISDSDMAQMNYLVDAEQQKPENVAHDFLVEKGLI